MGKNKLRRFEENKSFPNLFEPSFSEVFQKDHPYKGVWNQKVFKNKHPIVLELGCGKGEYTLSMAQREANKNFIGIDIKGARLWRGAKTAFEEKIKNVAFIRTRLNYRPFLLREKYLKSGLLFLIRSQKKTNALRHLAFLTLITFLEPGSLIHLKTDSRPLHDYTLEVIASHKALTLLEQMPTSITAKEFPTICYSCTNIYENLF